MERLPWNNDNKGCDLNRDVDRYRERYGHYSELLIPTKSTGRERNGSDARDYESTERLKPIKEHESISNTAKGELGQAQQCYSMAMVVVPVLHAFSNRSHGG
jgi:hypothetical protein